MKCQAILILLGVSNRLWVAGLGRKKRKVRIKPALRLKRIRYPHMKIKNTLPVEALNLIVMSKYLPVKVKNSADILTMLSNCVIIALWS